MDLISIHPPRAGRDSPALALTAPPAYFNPRAPCGARPTSSVLRPKSLKFQSTRPVRGATVSDSDTIKRNRDFNPRAPCGARPGCRSCHPGKG